LQLYTCDVQSYKTNLGAIKSVGGLHKRRQSTATVHGVLIEEKEMKILVDGLGTVFPSLFKLEIISANLSEVKRSNFYYMKNLVTLTAKSNKIEDLPEDVFIDLENLESLDLTENYLKELPEKLLENLGYLRTFSVSDNEIEFISGNLFAKNKNLQRIEFENNKLRTIMVKFADLPMVEMINLNFNPCVFNVMLFEKEHEKNKKKRLNEFDNKIRKKCTIKKKESAEIATEEMKEEEMLEQQ
jgi:Leucine-rich repeat (LRR) protein